MHDTRLLQLVDWRALTKARLGKIDHDALPLSVPGGLPPALQRCNSY